MEHSEIEKSQPLILAALVDYLPNDVAVKTILQKPTGNISLLSFDDDKGSVVKIVPFDLFAQIIEGTGEIVIDGVSNVLENGQGIVIPAHNSYFIKPNKRFKMTLATIKSGYESV